MTNFEHIKEIKDDDVALENFLANLAKHVCDSMWLLDTDPDKSCSEHCKQGVFMWLIGNYDPECKVWENEEEGFWDDEERW